MPKRTWGMRIVGAAALLAALGMAGCQAGERTAAAPASDETLDAAMFAMLEASEEPRVDLAMLVPMEGVPVRLYVVPEDANQNAQALRYAVVLDHLVTDLGGQSVQLYVHGFPSNADIFADPTSLPSSTTVQNGRFVKTDAISLKTSGRKNGYVVVIAEVSPGVYDHAVAKVTAN